MRNGRLNGKFLSIRSQCPEHSTRTHSAVGRARLFQSVVNSLCVCAETRGINRSMELPIASSAEQPNIISAEALNNKMCCSLSTAMIASIAESTMAASRAWLSSQLNLSAFAAGNILGCATKMSYESMRVAHYLAKTTNPMRQPSARANSSSRSCIVPFSKALFIDALRRFQLSSVNRLSKSRIKGRGNPGVHP